MAELTGERQGRSPLVLFIFSLVIVQGLTINLMPVLFGTMKKEFGVAVRRIRSARQIARKVGCPSRDAF